MGQVVVFNSLATERSAIVSVALPATLASRVTVLDQNGQQVPAQLSERHTSHATVRVAHPGL